MSVKVISENNCNRYLEAINLAKSIREHYEVINLHETAIENDKNALKDISKEQFFEDINKDGTPEINSSHEYNIDGNIVRVSFKVKSRPMTEINGKPANKALQEVFKEHTDKLFESIPSYRITADESTLRAQACEHPELFRIALKPGLTHEQLMKLVASHPELLNVEVTDPKTYSNVYSDKVETTVTISPNNGFVEQTDKLEPVLKEKARGFLTTFFEKVIQPSVICGNKKK